MTHIKQQIKVMLPTWNTEYHGEPEKPVLMQEEAYGTRILLNSHNEKEAEDRHDVSELFLERRNNGWCLTICGIYLGDPNGSLFIHDDGRVFLRSDTDFMNYSMIETLDAADDNPVD